MNPKCVNLKEQFEKQPPAVGFDAEVEYSSNSNKTKRCRLSV